LFGGLVEQLGQFLAAVGLGEASVAGRDEVLAADRLVELDRPGQGVAGERVGPDVGAGDL